jgi:hypothetical protein
MTIQPSTVPAPCFRCVGADIAGTGPIDGLCWACRGEVSRNREDARDELVSTQPPQPSPGTPQTAPTSPASCG